MSSEAPVHTWDRQPNFDRHPTVPAGPASACRVGWDDIAAQLRSSGAHRVVVEAYPGVYDKDLRLLADRLGADRIVDAADAYKPGDDIAAMVQPYVTDDPVFGRLNDLTIDDFFDPVALARLRAEVRDSDGRIVVVGAGASRVAEPDVLVYADMPRWEAQQRQRRGEIANLGVNNIELRASLRYKHAYFVDWRVADRLKRSLFERTDYLLDTTVPGEPKMITGADHLRALAAVARRPFEVMPFFDPGPWGGQWMKEVCNLPPDEPNYAWCFNCVPEENSLLLGFGHHRVEIPSLNLVFREPEALLGSYVRERFGDEFPIRFDFLDTMGGGNLSLQVHPLTSYIREHFGVSYTQDESYYMMDAEAGSTVYLGLKTDVDREAMVADLRRAQDGGFSFPAETYVNRFPAKRHDHFLIPAGTVHCSGAGGMVLEISATPYIFTFKLWDWDRLGLDGRPRPINIERGEANIQWHRDTRYALDRLVNQITPLGAGDGWRAERTGLHEAEFIDTHRHWFTGRVHHETGGGVNVLNLVQGEEAVVESPDGAFAPFVVHYAETFIVPAAVGRYTIRPYGRAEGSECATIKAFVRPDA